MTKTNPTTKPATYRIVRLTLDDGSPRFLGIAWNYGVGVLLATTDCPSYTAAREELGTLADSRAVTLKWFDGEYYTRHGDDMMYPVQD